MAFLPFFKRVRRDARYAHHFVEGLPVAIRIAAALALPESGSFALATTPSLPVSQEGRILTALGLTRGPLPRVSLDCLAKYYSYLAANLQFPFDAGCPEESGFVRAWTSVVTVVQLLSPTASSADEDEGLRCRVFRGAVATEVSLVDLEVENDHPNAQLIEDYWYWSWNWRFDPRI
jgi:hypothetical protein